MRTTWLTLAAAFAAAGLAGCGGGHDAAPAPPPAADEVPASATVSTAAFVDFTGSLAPSETQPPLDITTAVPPTSETEPPQPVG